MPHGLTWSCLPSQEYARLHLEALKRDLLRGPDRDFIT